MKWIIRCKTKAGKEHVLIRRSQPSFAQLVSALTKWGWPIIQVYKEPDHAQATETKHPEAVRPEPGTVERIILDAYQRIPNPLRRIEGITLKAGGVNKADADGTLYHYANVAEAIRVVGNIYSTNVEIAYRQQVYEGSQTGNCFRSIKRSYDTQHIRRIREEENARRAQFETATLYKRGQNPEQRSARYSAHCYFVRERRWKALKRGSYGSFHWSDD